mmetsp:Transcript_19784/g.54971  ORF Transcript_19784/g.54971 Transcript_19784/m.54971 type:complete len:254 (-) Transcript_19784:1627-2388(-)
MEKSQLISAMQRPYSASTATEYAPHLQTLMRKSAAPNATVSSPHVCYEGAAMPRSPYSERLRVPTTSRDMYRKTRPATPKRRPVSSSGRVVDCLHASERMAANAALGSQKLAWGANAPLASAVWEPAKIQLRKQRARSDVERLEGVKARRTASAGTSKPKRTPTRAEREAGIGVSDLALGGRKIVSGRSPRGESGTSARLTVTYPEPRRATGHSSVTSMNGRTTLQPHLPAAKGMDVGSELLSTRGYRLTNPR